MSFKKTLKHSQGQNVETVRKNLSALSADWDTLRADEHEPNSLKADAN